jgi:hypothetical protein
LKETADLTTPEGIMAYQKALKELNKDKDAEEESNGTPSNASTQPGVQGASPAVKFTAQQEADAIARMTK